MSGRVSHLTVVLQRDFHAEEAAMLCDAIGLLSGVCSCKPGRSDSYAETVAAQREPASVRHLVKGVLALMDNPAGQAKLARLIAEVEA